MEVVAMLKRQLKYIAAREFGFSIQKKKFLHTTPC